MPERNPKGLQLAKQWNEAVEEVHRLQCAGYRDVTQYEDLGLNPTFVYFDRNREYQSKDINKVKLYRYD
eukprot:Clim_evm69s77 gene=Clim_evmTU69s77